MKKIKNHAFEKFMKTEAHLIEISKWIAGEKLGRDPGQEYIAQWIKEHAEKLRDAWNKSKCKTCKKPCSHNLRTYCEDYAPDSEDLLLT